MTAAAEMRERIRDYVMQIGDLTLERDEARAEVERLRTEADGRRADGYAQAIADLGDRDAYLAWWRGQDGERGQDLTWIEPVAQIRAAMFLRSRSQA